MGKRGSAAKREGSSASSLQAELLDRFGEQLGDPSLVKRLVASDDASGDVVEGLALLAEQAVRMGIDYKTLKGGWHHPGARTIYRAAEHRSIRATSSRSRAEETRQRIAEAAASIADGEAEGEAALVALFVQEIGLPDGSPAGAAATFPGVLAALRAELVLPMRAQVECQMNRSLCGAPLPQDELKEAVMAVTKAVLAGSFSEWRYTNPVGVEQLRGLDEQQVEAWREATTIEHTQGLTTHEDAPGELGYYWATKIGGPSHGFDYESQCLMPLLANARHKVIFVSVPQWPHHPIGRAHWRLLWAAKDGGKRQRGGKEPPVEPRLWLETVNCDFEAGDLYGDSWDSAVMQHAVAKANAMRVPLSVESYNKEDLKRAVKAMGGDGGRAQIQEVRERMVLRPSNAVIEASDYLSSEHDWVQTEVEITSAFERALYRPEGC